MTPKEKFEKFWQSENHSHSHVEGSTQQPHGNYQMSVVRNKIAISPTKQGHRLRQRLGMVR